MVTDDEFEQLGQGTTQRFMTHAVNIQFHPGEAFKNPFADGRIESAQITFRALGELETVHHESVPKSSRISARV